MVEPLIASSEHIHVNTPHTVRSCSLWMLVAPPYSSLVPLAPHLNSMLLWTEALLEGEQQILRSCSSPRTTQYEHRTTDVYILNIGRDIDIVIFLPKVGIDIQTDL